MPEALVAMPVARAPLEERADVEDAVAPPREHGHAVVAPLHIPTGLPTLAVVGAPIHPPIAHPQQARELSPAAGMPPRAPGPHRTRGPGLRRLARAQVRQVFPPVVSRLARGRVGEDPREPLPRRRRAIRRTLAKWLQRPVAPGVLGWPTPSGPRNRVGRSCDADGHVEPGPMAQAHHRIPPMQVANLPPAVAAPGPVAGALHVDEPMPVVGPLCGEDATIGPVQ
jgi:hypothetical protein